MYDLIGISYSGSGERVAAHSREMDTSWISEHQVLYSFPVNKGSFSSLYPHSTKHDSKKDPDEVALEAPALTQRLHQQQGKKGTFQYVIFTLKCIKIGFGLSTRGDFMRKRG